MSEEVKKSFDLGPILPMFGAGVDLGERLGDLAAGQKQLENGLKELKQDLKEFEAKFSAKFDAIDSRLDRVESRLDRLDERAKNLSMVTWGGIIVLLIAIIAQKLL